MKRLLVGGTIITVAAVMVWIFASAFGKDVREVPFMLRGQMAPNFELERLDGQGKISLAALRGRPVVMNVWASWCGPCAAEHQVIEWGAKRYASRVQFLGLVFEDTRENANAYLAQHGGYSFPQLWDEGSQVAVEYAVAGVPETYFIDATGRIVDKYVGPISPDELAGRIESLSRPVAAQGRTP